MGMRHSLLIGGVVSIGALMAAACSSSSNGGVADDDAGSSGTSGGTSGTSGGTSGSSGTSGTSGSSGDPDGGDGGDGGPGTPALKAGELVLIGVTKDAQVVYTVKGTGTTRNVEAVPVAGGAPATVGTIATDDDIAIVGNSVAWYTDVDANGVGKLNLWSKAGGAKAAVATNSPVGFISASEDGARLAFGFNTPADTVDVAITTAAAPSSAANATTAVIAGLNIKDCQPDFGFVGKIFFSAQCVGTSTNANLVTIPDASVTVTTLVDGTTAANALKATWLADKAGTKLFVMGIQNNQARVVTVAGATVARIENNVRAGILSDDGTKLFYWTGVASPPATAPGTDGAIRSAPTNATNAAPANPPAGAVTLVTAPGFPGIGNVTGVASDKSHILIRKLARVAPAGEVPRTDINVIDTTTAAQTPTVILPTATGLVAGFTATNSHLIFQTEVSAQGLGKLKVRGLAAGGADRDVAAAALLARPLPTGTKGLFVDNPKQVGDGVTVDVKVFDAAATAAPTTVVAGVDPFFEISGTKLVYVKPGATGGLYASDIP